MHQSSSNLCVLVSRMGILPHYFRNPAGTGCKIAPATSKDLSRLLQLLGFALSIMELCGLLRQVWYDLEQQCIY